MSQPSLQQTHLRQLAYNAINTYFIEHAHEVIEITILPPELVPSGEFILQDGANLGLPKKTLALAFVHARHLFFEHKHHEFDHSSDFPPDCQTIALEATRVMLLFDPEHLTAANYRKRHLKSLDVKGQEGARAEAQWAELRFLDTILTSPLHRQSKSPTLWLHRWYLAAYLVPAIVFGEWSAFFRTELEAVCKAGERHPKNYYAWLYARRLFNTGPDILHEEQWRKLVSECVVVVKDWCCQHPSDISGWMFLVWLLGRVGVDERASAVRQVVEYATSVHLTNESLWVFVRTVMANGTIREEESQEIMRPMHEHLQAGKQSPLQERISQTLSWIEKNKRVSGLEDVTDQLQDMKISEFFTSMRSFPLRWQITYQTASGSDPQR